MHFYLVEPEPTEFWSIFKHICTFLLLLSSMIPISLYVTLEMAKVGQKYLINKDFAMYHARL